MPSVTTSAIAASSLTGREGIQILRRQKDPSGGRGWIGGSCGGIVPPSLPGSRPQPSTTSWGFFLTPHQGALLSSQTWEVLISPEHRVSREPRVSLGDFHLRSEKIYAREGLGEPFSAARGTGLWGVPCLLHPPLPCSLPFGAFSCSQSFVTAMQGACFTT